MLKKNKSEKINNKENTKKVIISDFLDSSKYSPEEEKRMHEEELKKIFSAMDWNDWIIAIEFAPYSIILDRLRNELIEKDRWKEKIEEMYQEFTPKETESDLKTKIIWKEKK